MLRLVRTLQTLLRDRCGGMAFMFALSLVPLSIAALGATDLMRTTDVRSQLQDALDAAALTAARDTVADPTHLQDIGAAAFTQNLQDAKLSVVSGPTFVLGDKRIVIADAGARVTGTTLAQFIPGYDLIVKAHSEVASSGANIEVSLVLDTTGSMDAISPGGTTKKIDELKRAAKQLVDIVVQTNQTPFYSKMAVIPYSAGVNVDTFAASLRGTVTAGECVYPALPTCQKYKFPTEAVDSHGVRIWQSYDITKCVTERVDANTFNDSLTVPFGKLYAPGSSCPDTAATPLSTNKAAIKSTIDTLRAEGATAGHLGLAWGWYMVSPTFMGGYQDVAARPAAYGTDKLFKVVVMMTDGKFNVAYCNAVSGSDSGDDPKGKSSANINCPATKGTSFAQAKILCDNIKAKGVIIYTVGYYGADATQADKDMLNGCATDSDHAYLPTSGVQLQDAFASIGYDITKLRLSR